MLKLICGPSGAGKSRAIMEALKRDIADGVRSFLLVPEQQAYISERECAEQLPKNAGLFFEVVNFSVLAKDVFREYGGVVCPTVQKEIRSVLMWDTLRTAAPMLTHYRKSGGFDNSFIFTVLSAMDELRSNGIDSEQLEELLKVLPSDTALFRKLSDLDLLSAMFRAKTEECFGAAPADELLRLSEVLREHPYFRGCHIYIDSFTSFTVPEYRVLQALMKQADCVTVALCTDRPFSKLPHFETVTQTVKRLLECADLAGVAVNTQTLTANAAKRPADLALLEQYLWKFRLSSAERTQLRETPSPNIALCSCANIYEEAEAAALTVAELLQSGMHCGEIAILVRDTDDYRGVLDATLRRHQIPYFLSQRTELSSKPFYRFILSALRCVQRNYRAQDVMMFLKTELLGTNRRDAALFEEYCETWHISGSRFLDDEWSMNPDGLTAERSPRADAILEAANRVRKQLILPLRALAADLSISAQLQHQCAALYRFFEQLQIAQTLSDRAEEELAAGDVREAGETLRLYSAVTEALTTLSKLLPDTEVTPEEFSNLLSLMLAESDMGSVPNVSDCVVIGSASTLRVENIRASLLLGLCEGAFPKTIDSDGILSDSEKEELKQHGMLFYSNQALRTSEELMFVYRAMTKPTERLFLFTATTKSDGSVRTPSLAFTRVAELFGKEPESFDLQACRQAAVANAPQPTDRASEPPLRFPALPAGSQLYLSQSKIHDFMLCPYRYFSTYVLRLREQKNATPSYADDGNFLHYIFEHFLKSSLQDDGSLVPPATDRIEELADDIIADYFAQIYPLPTEQFSQRMLHLFERLRRLALLMLDDILGELNAGAFTPYAFEKIIGGNGEGDLPPVTLTLPNGSRVFLSGKVDRIDLYRHDDKLYVRIVDYKSGEHRFSVDEVCSGEDIQLVLYLFAVLAKQKGDFEPAGAQYLYAANEDGSTQIRRSGFLLDESDIIDAADQTPTHLYTAKLLKQSREDIDELNDQMLHAVATIALRISDGEAQKTPSEKACAYCPIRQSCDSAYKEK